MFLFLNWATRESDCNYSYEQTRKLKQANHEVLSLPCHLIMIVTCNIHMYSQNIFPNTFGNSNIYGKASNTPFTTLMFLDLTKYGATPTHPLSTATLKSHPVGMDET